jgi:hypothetical protein
VAVRGEPVDVDEQVTRMPKTAVLLELCVFGFGFLNDEDIVVQCKSTNQGRHVGWAWDLCDNRLILVERHLDADAREAYVVTQRNREGG